MVRVSPITLALTVFGSGVLSLPQPPSASIVGLPNGAVNPAFLAETPTEPQVFEKRATTTTAIPSVTKASAFTNGAGNNNNAQTNDGIKTVTDKYTCYSGTWKNYPPPSKWLSFAAMWNYNKVNFKNACQNLGVKTGNDTDLQIQQIYQGIQTVAKESLIDHRFILAVIVQESLGCVYVPTTEAPDGSTRNPGLMQSHNGTTYDPKNSAASILQMIRDGTEGTQYGNGLVQLVNYYGDIYDAARGYNSGRVNRTQLNDGFAATATYVSDIGNRMTGWLYATRPKCPGIA